MAIGRKLSFVVVLLLSFCFATLAFAVNTVLAEDDNNINMDCYLEVAGVIDYWCGPDYMYFKGVYDVYRCSDGSRDWRLVSSPVIVEDYCPYFN